MSDSDSRPPTGFGKGVNDYLNHYITLTDSKAGALLAASVAVGALLLSDDWKALTHAGKLARGASLMLFAAAGGCAAWVVYPRLPSGRRGVIFWEDIRSHKDLSDYSNAVRELDSDAVEHEYAAQNYFVSAVLHSKMMVTQSAIRLFIGGLVAATMAAVWG
jgi:hypothetical protein